MTTLLLLQPRPFKGFSVRNTLGLIEPELFEITDVATVAEALHRLEQRVFDVAVVDLAAPGSNGARVVTTIRRLAPRLPIVVLVEAGDESLAHRALALGARDYLVKRSSDALLVPRVIRHAIEMDRAEAERAQILDTLRTSTARCRSLFENAVVGMAFATFGGRITSVNDALCEMVGHSEEEILAESLQWLVHPDEAPIDWSFLAELREGRLATHEMECRLRQSAGGELWGLANVSLVRDAGGMPLQLVFKVSDITRRKAAEKAMRRSQEESRLILETAHDAFVACDEHGVIRDWNPRAEGVFGWRRADVLGRTVAETILPPAWDKEYRALLDRFRATGDSPLFHRQLEGTLRHREGRDVPVEITMWPTPTGEHCRVNAFIRDISQRVRAEQALHDSHVKFRAIFEDSSIGMAIGDSGGRVVASNRRLQKMLGYSAEELRGKTYAELVHPEDALIKDRARRDLLSGRRDTYIAERRYRRKDGQTVWLRVHASLVRDAQGRPDCIVNVLEDLTERKQAEAAMRERAMQLVDLVAAAATEATTADEVLQIVLHHVCSRMEWPVGHVYLTVPGEPDQLAPTDLWHVSDPERFHPFREVTMSTRLRSGEALPGRVHATGQHEWVTDLSKQGDSPRQEAASRCGIKGAFGSPLLLGNRVIGVLEFFSTEAVSPDKHFQDAIAEIGHQLGRVIERKRVDAFYAHQALHDPLTDLPNRLLFVDRLRHALGRLERSEARLALLFIDLDGFKDVNDTFGHDVGDSVLVSLSQRIRHLLRPGDTIARFGGDEFTVLCENVTEAQVAGIAQRILEVFAEPLAFEDLRLVITASVGIAIAHGHEERAESLIRNADAAMYRAKERGGSCFQVFDEPLRKRVAHRRGMEWSLRRAIEANQLRVYYQPSVALRDGRLAGLEALVRWEHPERGLLTPIDFIPLAEETGLVIPIGQWVFREACRQRARWRDRFPRQPLPDLSVNLSSRQLTYGELPERLSEAIEESKLDARDLCLEITETSLVEEESAIAELQSLRALGVALSIDDFGTGYSSLACLKRLPVAQIKLDRSFVAGLGTEARDEAIVGGVIGMAHALGLTVVAEGVETEKQLASLKALKCDAAQGFYFSTPQPAEAMTAMFAEMGTAIAA